MEYMNTVNNKMRKHALCSLCTICAVNALSELLDINFFRLIEISMRSNDSVELYYHKLKGHWDELSALETTLVCTWDGECKCSNSWY